MLSTLVLSVCLDSSLLKTRRALLESAGYTVVSAFSLREAVDRFRDGDFDLILLSHSLPKQDRDRLVCLIRASGSRIPVVFLAAGLDPNDTFADETVGSDPDSLLKGIREALIKAARVTG